MIRKRFQSYLGIILAGLFAAACAWAGRGQTRPSMTVEGVLRQLDSAAKGFHSLSADVERTKVTVVVDDKSTESGSMLLRGDKMLLQMKAPDQRTILRTGDNLYVYTPGLNRVEEYNLGKNRSLVDQFLLLGFATQGKELQKNYLITVLSEPVLNERKTIELELTPKSEEVRNQFSRIEIWLDEATWLPIQQQFNETGSGDYTVIRYTRMVRNPGIDESEFKPHWPKGTEKLKH